MKKQKQFIIVYITLLAISFASYMGFFFLQMNKQFTVSLFINYWLILSLTVSNIFVFYYLLKDTFGKSAYKKKFFDLNIEVLVAWILILFLLVIATFVCWQDYFINTFIPSISNITSQLKYLVILSLPTGAIILFVALLVVPQFIFLCRMFLKYFTKKEKHLH